MGMILSHLRDIENLKFKDMRAGDTFAAKRVLFIDPNRAVVELQTGTFVVIGPDRPSRGRVASWGFGASGKSAAVLYAFARMGILTKQQVAEHIERQQKAVDARNRKDAKELLKMACERLGIATPAVPE